MAPANTVARNPEHRRLKSFIMGSKRACALLQEETLPLSSEVVYDTDVLEKIV